MTTDTAETTTRTIGRASVESQELAKFLANVETGQIVTYQELNTAAKIDVQGFPNVLQTARQMVRRERRMEFGTIRGIGVKRLSDDEIPEEASAGIKRAKNIAKKSKRILGSADYSKLTPEKKIQHTTTGIILGLMESAGKRKTLNLAEQAARVSNGTLNIGDVTTLFKKPAAEG